MTPPTLETLEEDRRLSECLLWPLIEKFYGENGPRAFEQTPYYPTNNAYLAETYADLILAFYSDLAETLDPEEPVYILEWASGVGLLGFLVTTALQERWSKHPRLAALRWVYVLSDFTERNLAEWAGDPQLKPAFDRGELDMALWLPEEDRQLTLRRSGRTLRAGQIANPILVLANYFFDSIRHDYFRAEKSHLWEARVKVQRPRSSAPCTLAELQLKERYVPLPASSAYYESPRVQAALEACARTDERVSFLFPIGAFRCLENLHHLSDGRFGLLAADKGFHRQAYVTGDIPLPYTPHTGSFSFSVNFHALVHYFRASLGEVESGGTAQKGQAFLGPENPTLTCLAAATSVLPAGGAFTVLAQRLIERLAWPQAGYPLAHLATHFSPPADLPAEQRIHTLLTALRLAAFDSWVFARVAEPLCSLYPNNEYGTTADLRLALAEVAKRLHRRSVGADEAARQLRRLYFVLGDHETCLRWNHLTQLWFGEDRDCFFYPAAIAEKRGEWTTALQGFQRAQHCDPACAITAAALVRVREKRGDRVNF